MNKDFSQLLALTHHLNATLQIANVISSPFTKSPLFTSSPHFTNNFLKLQSTKFFRVGESVFKGSAFPIQISHCHFTESIQPIHLNGETGRQVHNTRRLLNNQEIKLDSLMFEFCSTVKTNGGAVNLHECASEIKNCFFFQCSAKNGGGATIFGGRSQMTECNFVKCTAKSKGGGLSIQESNVLISHSKFVENRAEIAGGLWSMTCHITFHNNKLYYNRATEKYGGCFLGETDGTFLQSYFYQNSAIQEKVGYTLAISDTLDVICIETNSFYENEEWPISVTPGTYAFFTNNHFVLSEESTLKYIEKGEGEKLFVINNEYYDSYQMTALPQLSAELYREVFTYDEIEPQFDWRTLYFVMSVFILILAILSIFSPLLIQPTKATSGWERADSL